MNRSHSFGGVARVTAVALAGCLALAACSSEPSDEPAAVQDESVTLAGVLEGTDGLDQAAALVDAAHMRDVLEGIGPYTLLAPSDVALNRLDAAQRDYLTSEEGRPELASLLSAHILPGALTLADLTAALERAGTVEMTSMAGTNVVFGREGGNVLARLGDGEAAHISGESRASNGMVLVLDDMLSTPAAAEE